MTIRRRLIRWLLGLLGDCTLRYPTFYACVIDRERVADVSTNLNRVRAACIEQIALGKNARVVTYLPSKAESTK